MKIYKTASLIILLLLISLLFVSGAVNLQSVLNVFTQNLGSFLHMIIVFAGCLIFAPILGAWLYSARKVWRGLLFLLAGLAASGAALMTLFTIKFATGTEAAVIIAVFISALVISAVFIISNARGHEKTLQRLEERGVRTAVIRRRTAIKNAYALFFENSGRIASAIVALYLIGDIMVESGGVGCRIAEGADTLSCLIALLLSVAVMAFAGNLLSHGLDR